MERGGAIIIAPSLLLVIFRLEMCRACFSFFQ